MKFVKKIASFLAVASVALMAGTSFVSAAPTTPAPGSLPLILSATPNLGSSLNVSGNCGLSGANGNTHIDLVGASGAQTPIGFATANPDGTFSVPVTIPGNFALGPITLRATCFPNGYIAEQTITILPAVVTVNPNLNVGGTNEGTTPTSTSLLQVNPNLGAPTMPTSTSTVQPQVLGLSTPRTTTMTSSSGTTMVAAATTPSGAVGAGFGSTADDKAYTLIAVLMSLGGVALAAAVSVFYKKTSTV